MGFHVCSLFCYTVFGAFSSLGNHLIEEEIADCFTLIVFLMCVLCLFLMVPWIGLLCVIVAFPEIYSLFNLEI